ncbi:MAG: hypothetical protein ACHQFX_13145 [Chitinophagales bacterium]
MKKIFTLIAATILTVATTFAADRRPSVSLKSRGNYEIVIDGRSYFTRNGAMELSNIRKGSHTIRVYEVGRVFSFLRTKKLVDASTFIVRNNDIDINVDFRGQIRVSEERYGRDRWNDNDHDRYDRHDNDGRDRNGRF